MLSTSLENRKLLINVVIIYVSDMSAAGGMQCQDETAEAVRRLYCYVWYYVHLNLSDQKFVLWCGKD